MSVRAVPFLLLPNPLYLMNEIYSIFKLDRKWNATAGVWEISLSHFEEFSVSAPFVYTSIVYVIPPGEPYSHLEKLFSPFDMYIWTCICILLMVASFIIVFLKLVPKNVRAFVVGRTNSMPYFNLIGVFLGGSLTLYQCPTRNFARAILLIWLLSTLILRNSYSGKLFDHLCSNQRKPPFYKLTELYQSHLKLFVYPSAYNTTSEIVSKNRYSVIHCLNHISNLSLIFSS